MALRDEVRIEPGVTVPEGIDDKLLAIVQEYEKQVGNDPALRVTSGMRTASQQAQAMTSLIGAKGMDYARRLYGNNQLADAALDAYENSSGDKTAAMAAVIQGQVDEGKFLSGHMRGNKFDIATRGLKDRELFKKIARAKGCRVIDEGHCLDLNFTPGIKTDNPDDNIAPPDHSYPELRGNESEEELERYQDQIEGSFFVKLVTALLGFMQMFASSQESEQPDGPGAVPQIVASDTPPTPSRTA